MTKPEPERTSPFLADRAAAPILAGLLLSAYALATFVAILAAGSVPAVGIPLLVMAGALLVLADRACRELGRNRRRGFLGVLILGGLLVTVGLWNYATLLSLGVPPALFAALRVLGWGPRPT